MFLACVVSMFFHSVKNRFAVCVISMFFWLCCKYVLRFCQKQIWGLCYKHVFCLCCKYVLRFCQKPIRGLCYTHVLCLCCKYGLRVCQKQNWGLCYKHVFFCVVSMFCAVKNRFGVCVISMCFACVVSMCCASVQNRFGRISAVAARWFNCGAAEPCIRVTASRSSATWCVRTRTHRRPRYRVRSVRLRPSIPI